MFSVPISSSDHVCSYKAASITMSPKSDLFSYSVHFKHDCYIGHLETIPPMCHCKQNRVWGGEDIGEQGGPKIIALATTQRRVCFLWCHHRSQPVFFLLLGQCNRTNALDGLFSLLQQGNLSSQQQTSAAGGGAGGIVALVGSGCSIATTPTAEIAHFYNLPQVNDTLTYIYRQCQYTSCL